MCLLFSGLQQYDKVIVYAVGFQPTLSLEVTEVVVSV